MNTKRTPDLEDLNPDARAALIEFRDANGRYWKAKLMQHWYMGTDDRLPNGGHLRHIRNNFGPSWLSKLKD